MEKSALIISLLLLFPAASAAQDKLDSKKQNLEQVRKDLEEKRLELDRYKQEEEKITNEISGLKKEDKTQQARQRELEAQLTSARSRSSDSRQKYESLEKAWKRLSGDLGGEAAFYSFERTFRFPYYGTGDLSRELFVRNALIEKHLLISRIRGETDRVNKDIQSLQRKNLELKAKKELIEKQRNAHKKTVKNKMQELSAAKDRYARAQRAVEDLQNAANGLTRLVRKLEKQQPYKKASGSRELPIPRHSLSWPVAGKVISRFGKEAVPLLKTWIVREGIRIQAQEDSFVFPAMTGKVIYSGPFRTYGNVVIISHDPGFFTVYGLLRDIKAVKDELVTTSTPIGRAGVDTQAVSGSQQSADGTVYFEIRLGSDALDPLPWLVQ